LKFVDIPVFVCQENLKWAKEKKLVKDGVVIYNGIETPEFLERELARKFFEEKIKISLKEKFLIGSIGRLDYSKNYEFLIKIFPEILKIKPEAILIIIGEGSERKKLENLIEKLNLKERIFLIGEIKDASKYLKGFDLFVLPSRYEGFSIVLIESLFAKIPILASDVGGNKEIISENCIFQEKKNFLEKFKNLPFPLRNEENFKKEKMISQYLDLFSKNEKNIKAKN
ncbi:MAG: glycosyltransferase, partial [Candidatus Pacearchaeota archaeon]